MRRDLHFGPIRPKLAVRLQEHVAKSRSIVDKLQRKPVEALLSELLIGWAQRVGVPAHRGLDPSWRDYALHQRYSAMLAYPPAWFATDTQLTLAVDPTFQVRRCSLGIAGSWLPLKPCG